jgi:CBS-domain-containing membrane protein
VKPRLVLDVFRKLKNLPLVVVDEVAEEVEEVLEVVKEDLRKIIRKMMLRDRQERYQMQPEVGNLD